MAMSNNTLSRLGNISHQERTTATGNHSSQDKASEVREIVYGIIAALSFLLNALFCMVMIRRPGKLKRPHNILLFALAITDLLTGLYSNFVSVLKYYFLPNYFCVCCNCHNC